MDEDFEDKPLRHPFEDFEFEEPQSQWKDRITSAIPKKIPAFKGIPKIPPGTIKAVIVLAVLLFAAFMVFFVWPSMQPKPLQITLLIQDTEGNPVQNNKITFFDEKTKREIFSDQGKEKYELKITPGSFILTVIAPEFKTASFPINAKEKTTQKITLEKDLEIIIEKISPIPDIASGETKEAIITLRNTSRYDREIELVFEEFKKLRLRAVPQKIIVPAGETAKATIFVTLAEVVSWEETDAGIVRIKYTHESFPLTVKLLEERKQ